MFGGWVKYNTSFIADIGPLVDQATGGTPLNAFSTRPTPKIMLNGGTANSATNTLIFAANTSGMWKLVITSAEASTLGELTIVLDVSASNPVCRPFAIHYQVLPAETYERLMVTSKGMDSKKYVSTFN